MYRALYLGANQSIFEAQIANIQDTVYFIISFLRNVNVVVQR